MLSAGCLVVKLTGICLVICVRVFSCLFPSFGSHMGIYSLKIMNLDVLRKFHFFIIMFLVESCFDLCWMFVSLQILRHLENRHEVHREAINVCKDILQQKQVDWEPVLRNDLSEPISNVDLVVTVGGDGTLLRASHFLDESIPVLGVNSDPTLVDEVTL